MAKLIISVLLFLFPFSARAQELSVAPVSSAKIDAPKPNHRIFWIGTAALGASSAWDMSSTARTIDGGGKEYNPLFGPHPSHERIATLSAGMFAASASAFYLTERSHHRWIRWTGRAAVAFVIEQHVRLGFSSPKHGPPGFRF
jgi:hypothetical protein